MSQVDHFATLGLDRAAALDEAVVKEKFHELSREAHPDSEGGDEEKFAGINEAQRVLSSPSARLKHLIELEFGAEAKQAGEMSETLMGLFAEIGAALSEADGVILKRQTATTAVAKALLAGVEMGAQKKLMEAGGRLMERRQEVEEGLAETALNDEPALRNAAHELAFLEKWQRQVQERMGQLV